MPRRREALLTPVRTQVHVSVNLYVCAHATPYIPERVNLHMKCAYHEYIRTWQIKGGKGRGYEKENEAVKLRGDPYKEKSVSSSRWNFCLGYASA